MKPWLLVAVLLTLTAGYSALIPCPECKKEISDRAAACPHCGYQLPHPEQSQNRIVEISNVGTKTNRAYVIYAYPQPPRGSTAYLVIERGEQFAKSQAVSKTTGTRYIPVLTAPLDDSGRAAVELDAGFYRFSLTSDPRYRRNIAQPIYATIQTGKTTNVGYVGTR